MQLFIFLLIEVLLLLLAALTYLKAKNNSSAKSFALFIILVGIWQIVNFGIDEVSSPILGAIFARADYALGPMMGLALWYFVYYFPVRSSLNPLINRIILLFAASLTLLSIFTNYIVVGVSITNGAVKTIYGNQESVFTIGLGVILLASIIELWRKYRRVIGREKEQLKYVFVGFFFGVLIAGSVNLLAPIVYGTQAVPSYVTRMSLLGITVLIFLISYSILAHRLFDIRVIIKRTVIFAGLSAFTLSMYAAIVFIFSGLFGSQAGGNVFTLANIVPNFVAALVLASTLDPLRRWLTRVTDNWLFKGEYKQEDVLKNLATTLANVIDIDEAIKGMIQVVVDQMRLNKAVVFMLHPNSKQHEHELRGVVKVGEFADLSLKLSPKDDLVEYFEEMGIDVAELVVLEELQRMGEGGNSYRAAFVKRAAQLEASVVMPLIISRQEAVVTKPGTPTQTKEVKNLIGILALGAKKSGDTFSDKDLQLLQIVANETAAAIEKGRFFEEDRLKTEFVSIASHELLTPTTSMKGYLSMILDEGIGKVDPTARGYLVKVYSETNRLAVLVKDLLNVSRIERGKIAVDPKVQDVVPLVKQAVETQELKAKERNLKLTFEMPKKALPAVSVDSDKLLEVFINVIGNGLKYTKEGGVTVSLSATPTMVVVSVKDTGIGIAPNDLQHLFGKFFRASNSDETGQTGTGLGLYVSKYVTELMGGTIVVDSTIGKGTTFNIQLPVGEKAATPAQK